MSALTCGCDLECKPTPWICLAHREQRAVDGLTIVAAVNNPIACRQYLQSSSVLSGGHPHQLLLQQGFTSAAAAYNAALDEAEHDVVVFVHQDVVLPQTFTHDLDTAIAAAPPNWGILGVYGADAARRDLGRVWTQGLGSHGQPLLRLTPAETLDELVLIVRKDGGLRFDSELGFHLYGADLCLQARARGLGVFVFQSECRHYTNLQKRNAKAYAESACYLQAKWPQQLPIRTVCSTIAADAIELATANPRKKIPGVKPVTIVETDAGCTNAEMERRVNETRSKHVEILQQYHDVWYNAPHTWHFLHFLGVGTMKCPNDLWMYQELMSLHRPQVVIETGTYAGGSALWFANLMEMLAIQDGRVYTVDFEDHRQVQSHPRITFLAGDSRDPAIRDVIVEDMHVRQIPPGPLMVVLDADHGAEHVRKELEIYAPLCKVGDWLIVEDTNISWPGDQGDRGARGGIEDYCAQHPGEFRQDVLCERWLLTMNPGGWLRRIAECPHGSH